MDTRAIPDTRNTSDHEVEAWPPHLSFHPRDPGFYGDPFAAYRVMHEAGGVFVWKEYAIKCFARHADVTKLLRDPRLGRVMPGPRPDQPTHVQRFERLERRSLLELEPPDHTVIRRTINRGFVSRRIAHLEGFLAERASELMRAADERGSLELLSEYAAPLAAETAAMLIGVPREDAPRLLEWSHAMVAMYRFDRDHEIEERADEAAGAFADYLEQIIRAGIAPEGSTLETMLADDRLDIDDIVSTTVLLLNAGHEATVHQLGNAVRELVPRLPTVEARAEWLRADPGLERTVEECLRHRPPLHLFTRRAVEDCEIEYGACPRPIPLAKGETIGLLLGAANRDPRRFERPDEFDPLREPGPHVAFGGGIHFCIGAPLARMEIAIALRTLFEHWPSLRMVKAPEVSDAFHFHGLEALRLAP